MPSLFGERPDEFRAVSRSPARVRIEPSRTHVARGIQEDLVPAHSGRQGMALLEATHWDPWNGRTWLLDLSQVSVVILRSFTPVDRRHGQVFQGRPVASRESDSPETPAKRRAERLSSVRARKLAYRMHFLPVVELEFRSIST
jgi:hypothetical protein